MDMAVSHNEFSWKQFTISIKNSTVLSLVSSIVGLNLVWKWLFLICEFYKFILAVENKDVGIDVSKKICIIVGFWTTQWICK